MVGVMAHTADPVQCRTCAFQCPGVCDATPSCALHAARTRMREQQASEDAAVERHYRYLVAAICRMTGRFDVARDLAQDVFLKALGHLDQFRQDAQFTTWLYAIARNRCYDFMKASAAAREVSDDTLEDAPPLVDNGALRALEIFEARRIVVRLMQDALLEPVERRVFLLHYGGDMPLDLVTRDLRLSNRSGAKAQIVSAKRKLGRAVTRWRGRGVRLR